MSNTKLFSGDHASTISANVNLLKDAGYSHPRAVRTALLHSKKHGKVIKMTKKQPKILSL